VFQLETNLGRKWAKELAPSDLTEMAALVSLMRPGCLRAIVDGKSMTQHYCDRKNAGDEVKYFHQALEPILQETYGVLTYQEQSMRIAQDLAGFDLQEADVLRKAIGKKKADIMAKVKGGFLEGCEKAEVITVEEAEEIFGWIQESQRYSFNKSHGVSYGLMGYWSAYVKAHFPFHFYTSWLYYSHEKMDPQEEMQLLISDARYFDIEVRPPSLNHVFQGDIGHFALYNDCVYFGIGDIKRIGEALVTKVTTNVKTVEEQLGRTIDKWAWSDFLVYFSDTITTTAVNGMVASGATDYMKGSRVQKIHEYETWRKLTQKERDWIRDHYNGEDLITAIQDMLQQKPRTTKPRMEKVMDVLYHAKNAPFSLEDTAYYIAQKETELLGVPITCSKLDTCTGHIEPDTTCKEFLQGKSGKMAIAVEITEAKEYIISKGKMKGQKMMFLSAEDATASLDSITIFPRTLEGNEPLLIKGSTVLLSGQRDRQRSESFIVDQIIQI
jgi:DNA polymerase-3 subunit alpha